MTPSLRCHLDTYRNEVKPLKQEQGKNHPISNEADNTHSQQVIRYLIEQAAKMHDLKDLGLL